MNAAGSARLVGSVVAALPTALSITLDVQPRNAQPPTHHRYTYLTRLHTQILIQYHLKQHCDASVTPPGGPPFPLAFRATSASV